MKHLSVAEITANLAEIAEKEAAHNARDFDAELRKVMVEGGDIDALENAQLEAEKQARRLRVHRSALEADLPIARKREAEIIIKEKHDEHVALRPEAAKSAARVLDAWNKLMTTLDEWETYREKSGKISEEIYRRCDDQGVELPEMGKFISKRIHALAPKAHGDLADRLNSSIGETLNVGRYVRGYHVDG
ncbi:hypothetical protein O9X98_15965 [Agrobacterium salinitolerans]|nr:hypothetical protein [Agrobacterium salinitolerans]